MLKNPISVLFVTVPLVSHASTCGVCTHISDNREFSICEPLLDHVQEAGIDSVRTDFIYTECCPTNGGGWRFDRYDRVFAEAERRGVVILPILMFVPSWGRLPFDEYAEKWTGFVRQMALRYRGRVPVYEVCNEENERFFFNDANPTNYIKVLRTAYREIKAADPSAKVMMGGVTGCAPDFVRTLYSLGMKDCCDIVAFHPYSHPLPPEREVLGDYDRLRAIMASYGDGKKPVWITEVGWPTQKPTIPDWSILKAGLKIAEPNGRGLNVIYLPIAKTIGPVESSIVTALQELLPSGSRVEAVLPEDVEAKLGSNGVDVVIYPFTEHFPAGTFDAVASFVERGGTLVDFGGMPLWAETTSTNYHADTWAFRKRLRVAVDAPWFNRALKPDLQCHATERGLAAGVLEEPTGFRSTRFLSGKSLLADDELIPLVAGKDSAGNAAIAAAVIRLHGGEGGKLVLCTLLKPGPQAGANNEESQAANVVRALSISMAAGMDGCFIYALRTSEANPNFSEDHFGILHRECAAKPAYEAYKTFMRFRPNGSVNSEARWHDGDKKVFCPQWTRPDGSRAGMIWSTGEQCQINLTPDEAHLSFSDIFGKRLYPTVTNGCSRITISGCPVYFTGRSKAKSLLSVFKGMLCGK